MAKTISQSIGYGGHNSSVQDIKTIQELLNNVPPRNGGPNPPLMVEGRNWGANWNRTVESILAFQRANLKGAADGRVDPESSGGKTIVALNSYGGQLPMFTEVSPPTAAPPVVPPASVPPPGSLIPRASVWHIVNAAGGGVSIAELGGSLSKIFVQSEKDSKIVYELRFAGGGLSLGPLPFGGSFSTTDMPNLQSRILRGVGTPADFSVDLLTGLTCIITFSVVGTSVGGMPVPAGGAVSIICFNCIPHSIWAGLASMAAMSVTAGTAVIGVALANSKAVGFLCGVSVGVDIGISVQAGLITKYDVSPP